MWALVEPLLPDAARVAIVGVGNGDDVPLARLADRAASVDLLDLDGQAARGAVARLPRRLRRRCTTFTRDVTAGAADAVVAAALRRDGPVVAVAPDLPLGAAPYDLVIGDLFYSQLLYPALLDAEIDSAGIDAAVRAAGPPLTLSVMRRMHRSVRVGGAVVHLHDVAGWWEGREQPVPLREVLGLPPEEIRRCGLRGPGSTDPLALLDEVDAPVAATRAWRWPFTAGVDYLVVGVAVVDDCELLSRLSARLGASLAESA